MRAIWKKVKKDSDNGCWEWQGGLSNKGYGVVWQLAHRVVYWMETGDEPPLLMHLCNNPKCVNPDHLKPGTHKENVQHKYISGNYGGNYSQGSNLRWAVPRIRDMLACGESLGYIATYFNCSRANVCNIKNGKAWAFFDGTI